jgi:hypothetical protein
MDDTPQKIKSLPVEINNRIREYTGEIKLRNGKYMRQIPKEDARYDLLRTIPPKKGGHFMVYNQIGYKVDVIKDGNPILSYNENNYSPQEGEISITHYHNNRTYKHVIGKKFPPCFMWAPEYKTTKKWIEYTPMEYLDT